MLLEKLPGICSAEEAHFVDNECDWSRAKHWAQWWCRSTHLRMLCKALTGMQSGTWDKYPSTTNAVERRNQDCSVCILKWL